MQNLFKFAFVAIAIMLFSFGSVEASGLPGGLVSFTQADDEPCEEFSFDNVNFVRVTESDIADGPGGRAIVLQADVICVEDGSVIAENATIIITLDAQTNVIDITVDGQTPNQTLYNAIIQEFV